jgi:hypothetical protein
MELQLLMLVVEGLVFIKPLESQELAVLVVEAQEQFLAELLQAEQKIQVAVAVELEAQTSELLKAVQVAQVL